MISSVEYVTFYFLEHFIPPRFYRVQRRELAFILSGPFSGSKDGCRFSVNPAGPQDQRLARAPNVALFEVVSDPQSQKASRPLNQGKLGTRPC